MSLTGYWLNNAWETPSGEPFTVDNPATGDTLWTGQSASADDVNAAVVAAGTANRAWRNSPLATRVAICERYAELLREEADALAVIIASETGKPVWEAKTEAGAMAGKIAISIRAQAERAGERSDAIAGGQAVLRHRPHGVAAVFGPYNFPGHLPNGHIVPALIAGNVVIFKPSEKTPAVGEFLTRCFHEAKVPEGVVQCIHGGVEVGQALVEHWMVDGVLFTGSARAGIAINRKLASDPGKIVALEMGGNNPIVMLDTPKIEDAAATIVQSAFTTAGQRCTAARRLIVVDSMFDKIVPAVKSLAERLIVDEPFAEPQPYMGCVIDNGTADLLSESFLALMSRGGSPIMHMKRRDEKLPFLSPAILDATEIHERPDIELFGPLLQVIRVPDFDAAIVEANNTRYGLSASLIGGKPADFEHFWSEIRAGIVNWNRPTNGASSAAPFGGVGLSGNHRPAAFYAADYCAYPVASNEMEQPRASLGVGLRES